MIFFAPIVTLFYDKVTICPTLKRICAHLLVILATPRFGFNPGLAETVKQPLGRVLRFPTNLGLSETST
jgi:hypothetical protein